jgi:hypothetical protein
MREIARHDHEGEAVVLAIDRAWTAAASRAAGSSAYRRRPCTDRDSLGAAATPHRFRGRHRHHGVSKNKSTNL